MSFIDFPVIEILVTGQLISRPIFGTYLFEYRVDFVNCLLHILNAFYGAHIQAGIDRKSEKRTFFLQPVIQVCTVQLQIRQGAVPGSSVGYAQPVRALLSLAGVS